MGEVVNVVPVDGDARLLFDADITDGSTPLVKTTARHGRGLVREFIHIPYHIGISVRQTGLQSGEYTSSCVGKRNSAAVVDYLPR